MVVLAISYAVYATGLLEPFVPVADLPVYWSLPAAGFVDVTGAPVGWGWIHVAGTADYLNMIGIMVLGSLALVSALSLAPGYAAARDWPYLAICLLLAGVLGLSMVGGWA